jgi:antitoxin HicB
VNRQFTYSVKLTKQKTGGYLVQFPDLPEAIAQGESMGDALLEAADCLGEAIANRVAMKLEIPPASRAANKQLVVALSATLAAKTALYLAIAESNMSNVKLAREMECDEKEVHRLLDPYYQSKMPRIEQALHVLGQRLEIGVSQL